MVSAEQDKRVVLHQGRRAGKMNDPRDPVGTSIDSEPTGRVARALCELMRSMLSRAVVARNRDAFVLDENAETTVDLDGHRASSSLDGLELDEPDDDAA